jgi:hypothetical protein
MGAAIIALQHLRVVVMYMPSVLPEGMQEMNEFCFNRHKSYISYRNDAQTLDCWGKTSLLPVIVPHQAVWYLGDKEAFYINFFSTCHLSTGDRGKGMNRVQW